MTTNRLVRWIPRFAAAGVVAGSLVLSAGPADALLIGLLLPGAGVQAVPEAPTRTAPPTATAGSVEVSPGTVAVRPSDGGLLPDFPLSCGFDRNLPNDDPCR